MTNCNKDLFGEPLAIGDYVLVALPQRVGDKPRLGRIVCTDPKYKTLQYARIGLKKPKIERAKASFLLKLSNEQMMMYALKKD